MFDGEIATDIQGNSQSSIAIHQLFSDSFFNEVL